MGHTQIWGFTLTKDELSQRAAALQTVIASVMSRLSTLNPDAVSRQDFKLLTADIVSLLSTFATITLEIQAHINTRSDEDLLAKSLKRLIDEMKTFKESQPDN